MNVHHPVSKPLWPPRERSLVLGQMFSRKFYEAELLESSVSFQQENKMETVLAVSGQELQLFPSCQFQRVRVACVILASLNIPALFLGDFQIVQETEEQASFGSFGR